MKANITLAADEDLIRRARRAARAQGRSLNDLIREHLRQIAGTQTDSSPSERLMQLVASAKVDSACVESWTRDDAYETIR